jgi:hypothetical protein
MVQAGYNRIMRIKWNHLLLVTLLAAIAFGGTFTCRSDNDDDDDRPPQTLILQSQAPMG